MSTCNKADDLPMTNVSRLLVTGGTRAASMAVLTTTVKGSITAVGERRIRSAACPRRSTSNAISLPTALTSVSHVTSAVTSRNKRECGGDVSGQRKRVGRAPVVHVPNTEWKRLTQANEVSRNRGDGGLLRPS